MMTQFSARLSLPRAVGIVTAFFSVACASPSARAVATAHVVMHSQNYDWVGMGRDYDITYTRPSSQVSPGFFYPSAEAIEAHAPSGIMFELQRGTPSPSASVNLRFGTGGLGTVIAPGTYNNAAHFPSTPSDPARPGIEVTVNGQSASSVTGSFTITDLTYYVGTNGLVALSSFAGTFEQHANGSPAALLGSITYSDPAPVPEPGSLALLACGAVGLLFRRRSK